MMKRYLLALPLLLGACHQPKPAPVTAATPVTKPVEHLEPTPAQKARRAQSEAICKAHNVPLYSNPDAFYTPTDDSVTLRTQDEVVDRALALLYTGLKAEGLEKSALEKLNGDYHIMDKLSPAEKQFVLNDHTTDQENSIASWNYESLHVMLWALGFIDDLHYPGTPCNTEADVKIIHDLSPQEFRAKAKLRSKKEILDQADLILRLHWATVDAGMRKVESPGQLNNDVIMERHHSLNWLIRYMGEAWDDVTQDT